MSLANMFLNLSKPARVLAVVGFFALCSIITVSAVALMKYRSEVPPVVSVAEHPITWHRDPYITIRVNTTDMTYPIDASKPAAEAAQGAPLMSLPATCLKGDDVANADYIVIFGNTSGYAVVAKSFEFAGKAEPDVQLCWVKGQESALKALHQLADQFVGLSDGNWIVWHEGTKAYAAWIEFRSPPAVNNRRF